MTTPTIYVRAQDYSDFQAANPDTEFNGADFDADFDGIKTSLDSLTVCLATIRRDDGELRNASVGVDQLKAEVTYLLNGVTPRGAWITARAYAVGDLVSQSNSVYIAVTAHTSGVFATDLSAGKWMQVSPMTGASNVSFSPSGSIASVTVQNAIQELDSEKQPLNSLLTAIAALAGAANKLIYLTGASTVAMADLSAFVRASLGAADSAAFATALSLLPLGGGTLTGPLVLSADPVVAKGAATKQYVDNRAAAGVAFKNRIINGDMSIDQRFSGGPATFTAGAGITGTVDRWYASCTGANITGQRVQGSGANRYAYRFTGAVSNTGLLFGQRIEAANIEDLLSQDVTVQLVLSSNSITSVTWNAYYANTTDTFSAKTSIATGSITINSSPTQYSFQFNAGANAIKGVAIEFTCGALLAGKTIDFEAVQLEAGSAATAFERKSLRQRQEECYRYYRKIERFSGGLNNFSTPGMGFNTNVLQLYTFKFDVQMRVAPTFTTSGSGFYILTGGTNVAATSLAAHATDEYGAMLRTANNTIAQDLPLILSIDAGGAGWMQFDAEL